MSLQGAGFPSLVRFLLIAAGVAAASGCSSIRVKTDWDREFDFASYHTYRWAPTERLPKGGPGPDRRLLDQRIRRAVDRELASKGYARREQGEADFLLVYHVKVRERIDIYEGYPWGWGSTVDYYPEGTLALSVVDAKLDHSVWQGWAVGIVGDVEESEKRIREAVHKILRRFPPR